MKTQKLLPFTGSIILILCINFSMFGQFHPHYLHSLSDLRAARWQIEHRPGNWQMSVDEVNAVKQIDETINDIKKASIDDGKDLNDHPKADEVQDHVGRLHKAVEFLKKAQGDVNQEEDNGFAQGLQGKALKHINDAIKLTEKAISDSQQSGGQQNGGKQSNGQQTGGKQGAQSSGSTTGTTSGTSTSSTTGTSTGQSGQQTEHPYYLHALSDLRLARWQIEHRPGNWDRTVDEVNAVKQIDIAIKDIKKASIDDGKDLNDHPKADEVQDHAGRLHKAVEYLNKALSDVKKDEDNTFAEALQGRVINHINEAIILTQKAIQQ